MTGCGRANTSSCLSQTLADAAGLFGTVLDVPGKASLPASAGRKRLAPLSRALLHPTSHPAAGLLSGFALAKP
ncbi:hypothetical protein HMPREF0262_03370 [Clostridium sp. ATCC 29733]|nr:hypothetical protein HMPREF0262_03370 [Clostridium sp. ATCC 29733]